MKNMQRSVQTAVRGLTGRLLLFALALGLTASVCSCSGDSSTLWPEPVPPIVENIPDQDILEGEAFATIALDEYVDDPDHPDANIIWTFAGNSQLNVSIDANRIATISTPSDGWTGSETIAFTATDPIGFSSEDSATFSVGLIEYAPLVLDDWAVSTPAEQNLDPDLVRELYRAAIYFDRRYVGHLYSVLVIKNGFLIAERYFSGRRYEIATPSASVTKCYTSVLTGIALNQDNSLASLDQLMYEYFPEYDWAGLDSRKMEITIRQMLKMRSGYPWEEHEGYMDDFASTTDWLELLEDFPLTHDPGTTYGYSNLTAHALAVIVARATDSRLADFAQTYLFDPLGVEGGYWPADEQGNNVGHGDLRIRPRDMAKFGQMVLSDGMYGETRVVPAEWLAESTQPYSYNIFGGEILYSFQHINYGYCWQTATCGDHEVVLAWGHGGQLIVIVRDLNMVVVTTADNLLGDFTPDGWERESGVMDIAGFFIGSITDW